MYQSKCPGPDVGGIRRCEPVTRLLFAPTETVCGIQESIEQPGYAQSNGHCDEADQKNGHECIRRGNVDRVDIDWDTGLQDVGRVVCDCLNFINCAELLERAECQSEIGGCGVIRRRVGQQGLRQRRRGRCFNVRIPWAYLSVYETDGRCGAGISEVAAGESTHVIDRVLELGVWGRDKSHCPCEVDGKGSIERWIVEAEQCCGGDCLVEMQEVE